MKRNNKRGRSITPCAWCHTHGQPGRVHLYGSVCPNKAEAIEWLKSKGWKPMEISLKMKSGEWFNDPILGNGRQWEFAVTEQQIRDGDVKYAEGLKRSMAEMQKASELKEKMKTIPTVEQAREEAQVEAPNE